MSGPKYALRPKFVFVERRTEEQVTEGSIELKCNFSFSLDWDKNAGFPMVIVPFLLRAVLLNILRNFQYEKFWA